MSVVSRIRTPDYPEVFRQQGIIPERPERSKKPVLTLRRSTPCSLVSTGLVFMPFTGISGKEKPTGIKLNQNISKAG